MTEEMIEELTKLREEAQLESSGCLGEVNISATFWLSLPRCASHKEAIATLPIQLTRLEGELVLAVTLAYYYIKVNYLCDNNRNS